jgi:hypothetical protein
MINKFIKQYKASNPGLPYFQTNPVDDALHHFKSDPKNIPRVACR